MTAGRALAALVLAAAAGLGAASPVSVAQSASRGGTIVGTVTTAARARPPLRVTVDPSVCGTSVPDESVAVDDAGRVRGAIVSIAGVKAPAPADAAVVNDGCRFVPRVVLLRPKGIVRMSSRDAVMHTVHAAPVAGKALFNLSLPIPNAVLSRPVDKPGVVVLSCSTHTWMRGYVYVTDEQAAVSGEDGTFRLEHVPAGVQRLRVWHETLRSEPVDVTVTDGETVRVEFTLAP